MKLADQVAAGDRRALARAITLVESHRPDHKREAAALLDALLSRTGNAIRIGISGPPGAGKSTFIEALGLHLVGQDRRVAVLAIDPSSARSGGSILGDKTRMADLARHTQAFVRPSPSSGALGGLAPATRDTLLVCEAAGYEIVIVETVGVGQSETAADDVVDTFLLLLPPGGGDELQGIKRGVMELADMVVVTKADGDLAPAARHAAAEYARALHLLLPKHRVWAPEVLAVSAILGTGVAEVWKAVLRHREAIEASGDLARRRAEQQVAAFRAALVGGLLDLAQHDPVLQRRADELAAAVREGTVNPTSAATSLLDHLAVALTGTADPPP